MQAQIKRSHESEKYCVDMDAVFPGLFIDDTLALGRVASTAGKMLQWAQPRGLVTSSSTYQPMYLHPKLNE